MKVVLNILLGVALTVVGLELVLRLLPTNHGWANPPITPELPMVREWPHADYVFSRAWDFEDVVSGRYNNLGYPAPDVALGAPAIGVIGNSYVEAVMIPEGERLRDELARHECVQVAALGVSGEGLAGYMVAAHWAAAHLRLNAVVILVTGGDLGGSTTQKFRGYWYHDAGGRLTTRASPVSRVRNLLNESRLFDYLYYQLKIGPQMLFEGWRRPGAMFSQEQDAPARDDAPMTSGKRPQQTRAAEKFISDAQELVRNGTVVVLVFDADRNAIYRGESGVAQDTPLLARLAEQAGVRVVDMAPIFAHDYALHHQRFEFDRADSHWNARAHKLVGMAVARSLAGGGVGCNSNRDGTRKQD